MNEEWEEERIVGTGCLENGERFVIKCCTKKYIDVQHPEDPARK